MKKPLTRARAERKRRGWRLEDAAFYSGLTLSETQKIETLRIVASLRQARKLADALGISPASLQDLVED